MEDKKTKKYTIASKIILTLVILLAIYTAFTNVNSTDPARIIGMIFGTVGVSFLLSFILGLLPYFIIRNKVKNPKIIVFGLIYISISLLAILGSNYNKGRNRNLTDNELKLSLKNSHVKACVDSGGSFEGCSCTFEGLINRLDTKGYIKMSKAFEKDLNSSESENYINIMKEENLKCLL